MIIGTATFFDGFDALSIAYVLPVLIRMWKLSPVEIGSIISIGYIGQLVGAIFFGWLAERRGRMLSLQLSVLVYTLFSFLAAFSWNYTSLSIFRSFQGLGLGGEVPVAGAYINEICKAKGRGRFFMLYEMVFAIGIFCAALTGNIIVPDLGWRAMFLIGAVPAVLIMAMRWMLPESPRWLAAQGRLAEADRIVTSLETLARKGGVELPPIAAVAEVGSRKTRVPELFQGIYRRRTLVVWVIWFASYFAMNGLQTWLPSLYTKVFGLPVKESLRYGLITQSFCIPASIACALFIDRTGRRSWFTGGFLIAGVCMLILWILGAKSAIQVLVLGTCVYASLITIASGLFLYTPEIYPTRMRAVATSIGSAWLRAASALAPVMVGLIVTNYSLAAVFLIIGIVLLAGGLITRLFAVETKGCVLEDISP